MKAFLCYERIEDDKKVREGNMGSSKQNVCKVNTRRAGGS